MNVDKDEKNNPCYGCATYTLAMDRCGNSFTNEDVSSNNDYGKCPCTLCVVKPMCGEPCEDYNDYNDYGG